jgi:hypothetical protein
MSSLIPGIAFSMRVITSLATRRNRRERSAPQRELTLTCKLRMHDLVIGLFMNRYEFGRAI